jgi:hypothetical protein
MTSETQAGDSRFVEVGWVLPGGSHQFRSLLLAPPLPSVPFAPRVFFAMRYMVPETILGEVVSWCLYLMTKSSHMRGSCGSASLPSALAYGP